MMYPTRKFTHLDETFTTNTPVADDHPMVVLRPDLFTKTKPSTKDKE